MTLKIFINLNPISMMIIGAQKAGTFPLLRHLGQHPGTCTSKRTEIDFFSLSQEYQRGYDRPYSEYFPDCSYKTNVVLAKHVAILNHPDELQRLYDHKSRVHCVSSFRSNEGGWTGLRNFLRPFRGVHKKYLSGYVVIYEFAVNQKCFSPAFIAAIVRSH